VRVVEAEGLIKSYGRTRALTGLDLTVAEGEIHGFLGPNGAGKSTTIRALLGQHRVDAGSATLFGGDPWRDGVGIHDRLAYVPGDVSLWPGLTGGECIDVLGGFQGHLDPARRDELIERFQLDPRKRARTYSKGNRQKVALVAALAADADLYVLDEPTSGLDPLMEAVFQEVITERNAEGRTVLLSSHILAEVEALCHRVTIVRNGRTVSTGTLAELRKGTRSFVTATTPAPLDLTALAEVQLLEQHTVTAGVHAEYAVPHDVLAGVVATVAAAQPVDLSVRPPSLEQLFLEHYREEG
jgi:ABC-2 type transport system ATP-binding protein